MAFIALSVRAGWLARLLRVVNLKPSPARYTRDRMAGDPLNDLLGLHSARVGGYRVVYKIGADHTVRVLSINHRADVYRPR